MIKRSFLAETIKTANWKEEIFEEVYYKLQKLLSENFLDKIYNFQLRECIKRNRILYYYGKLVMSDSLITEVIQTIYLRRELRYAGVTKILKMFRKDYCFTQMIFLVCRFIRNCYNCKQSKLKRSRL